MHPALTCPLHFVCSYLVVLVLCSRTTIWKSRNFLPPLSLSLCCCVSCPFSLGFSVMSPMGCHCPEKARSFPFWLVCKLPSKLRRLRCWLFCESRVRTWKPHSTVSRSPQPRPGFLSSLLSPSCLPGGGRIDALFSHEVGPVQSPSTQPPHLLQLQINSTRRSRRWVLLIPFVLPLCYFISKALWDSSMSLIVTGHICKWFL